MRPLTCHRVAPGRRSSGALRLRLQLGQRGGAPAGGRRVSALQPPESEGCCGVTGRQGSSAPGQGDAPPWCWPRPGRGSEALLQVRKPRAPGGVGPRLPCERHEQLPAAPARYGVTPIAEHRAEPSPPASDSGLRTWYFTHGGPGLRPEIRLGPPLISFEG